MTFEEYLESSGIKQRLKEGGRVNMGDVEAAFNFKAEIISSARNTIENIVGFINVDDLKYAESHMAYTGAQMWLRENNENL